MHEEIEATLKAYLETIYRLDYEACYEFFDKDETEEYKKIIQDFAEKIDYFGEAEDFLKRLDIKDVATLKAMSTKEFIIGMLKMISMEVGEQDLQRMVTSTQIISVDATDYLTIVKYSFDIKMFEDWTTIQTEISMLYKENRWQILFKPGMQNAFKVYEKDIDLYHERKSRDQIDKLTHHPDAMEPYTITGFTNMEGDVVIEARFKDAGEFSDGLAYVQILNNYGYIDAQGELVIKPRFAEARDFLEGLAAVQIYDDEKGDIWGLIDKEGKYVVKPIFGEIRPFEEGFAAVSIVEEYTSLWGFIDTQGKYLVEPTFTEVRDFEDGLAAVQQKADEEEYFWGLLDHEGNWVVEPHFMDIDRFYGDQATVYLPDGKVGMINLQGEYIVPPLYESLREFEDGLCAAMNEEGKWGYIDEQAKVVIPFSYYEAYDFEDGVAEVAVEKENGEIMYVHIDREGNWLD